jgi:hypothetical protein
MTCTGKVSKGVVVLPPGVELPEGAELDVSYHASRPITNTTFADRYKQFIGMADDLPTDLAENLDHYLHGHPKK